MTTSKHLITALEKSDWLDRMLIFAGLIFFVLVVLFILKQRLVDRGLRIALWWTRFVPDFSGDEALLAMEKGHASLSASSVVSTVVATASTVAASLVSSVVSSSTVSVDTSSDSPSPLSTMSEILSSAIPEASHDMNPSTASTAAEDAETAGVHDEL